MELIRGLHNLRDKHRGCVLTIGKFDGVHLGHQAVLSQVVEKAKELGLPSTVMVFEPQPEELFTQGREGLPADSLTDPERHQHSRRPDERRAAGTLPEGDPH